MEIIRAEHLNFTYNLAENRALKDIDFSIYEGEIVTLCGPSGCGKSTLLRQMKRVLAPFGDTSGHIYYRGTDISTLDRREETEKIGFVSQSADNQIVTDKVYHELAFGLESLGYKNAVIRQRVAEMAAFFGIQEWFHKGVEELSGGQKQILTLASVMTLIPEVIILDEPTSQLDPIAAQEFINMLVKINRELGTTIIIAEHRLDEILPHSDRVMVMKSGSIIALDKPVEVCRILREQGQSMFESMPVSVRLWSELGEGEYASCPITVNQAREWFHEYVAQHPLGDKINLLEQSCPSGTAKVIKTQNTPKTSIRLKDIWFKYEKNGRDILRGVNLDIYEGEIFGILGGNGTGKSTLLSVISGIRKSYRGKVVNIGKGKIVMLTQDPKNLFVKKKLIEDLEEMEKDKNRIREVIRICRLEELTDSNPYDLSGGEQQRAAIAKVLLTNPDVMLLDEPTKGMDNEYKRDFGKFLRELSTQGMTIVIVSHDVEFSAEWTDRCGLFFDGGIISVRETREFFSNNNFYTTVVNRIAGRYIKNAVTIQDVISVCKGNIEDKVKTDRDTAGNSRKNHGNIKEKSDRENAELRDSDSTERLEAKENSVKVKNRTGIQRIRKNNPADIRFIIAVVMVLAAIPFTIYIGIHFFEDTKFLFISLLIMFECMLPFFIMFEGRNPHTRELLIISVLCAISVAGRIVFYMLPEFKPVMAIDIIAAVSLGAETGFLVGAVSMLVSNMIFGQGPWTPWQMFAMGLTGFIAGMLFHRRNRGFQYDSVTHMILLCMYGFIGAVVIYGGIMNPAAAVMAHVKLSKGVLISYYLSGIPMDIIHGVATVVFLVLLTKPILEKLERIKNKYGI